MEEIIFYTAYDCKVPVGQNFTCLKHGVDYNSRYGKGHSLDEVLEFYRHNRYSRFIYVVQNDIIAELLGEVKEGYFTPTNRQFYVSLHMLVV